MDSDNSMILLIIKRYHNLSVFVRFMKSVLQPYTCSLIIFGYADLLVFID